LGNPSTTNPSTKNEGGTSLVSTKRSMFIMIAEISKTVDEVKPVGLFRCVSVFLWLRCGSNVSL
jgi:hypothetical protein